MILLLCVLLTDKNKITNQINLFQVDETQDDVDNKTDDWKFDERLSKEFESLGFFISGNYLNADIPLSLGFLNIPAFLIFFPITAFMARLGAKASHRIDKKKMTKYFGLFLVVIGTRFLYEYFKL